MTNPYWEKVKEVLFKYSNEEKDVNKARKEWRWYGYVEDNRASQEEQDYVDVKLYPNCQLCGHIGIRFSFEIINTHNDNKLMVGSECINKFIKVDIDGDVTDDYQSKKKILHKKVREKIKDLKLTKMIYNIIELGEKDKLFDKDSFLKNLDTKNGFTINQLKLLLSKYNTFHIHYDITNYKINLRKKREKEQLYGLEKWQFENFKPILSKEMQRRYLNKNNSTILP